MLLIATELSCLFVFTVTMWVPPCVSGLVSFSMQRKKLAVFIYVHMVLGSLYVLNVQCVLEALNQGMLHWQQQARLRCERVPATCAWLVLSCSSLDALKSDQRLKNRRISPTLLHLSLAWIAVGLVRHMWWSCGHRYYLAISRQTMYMVLDHALTCRPYIINLSQWIHPELWQCKNATVHMSGV